MSALSRIAFTFPSSGDSLSPPEKRAKQESWEKRMEMLLDGELSDCKIIVGNKTIPTHKFILSEFPYFEKKFATQINVEDDERDQINISGYEFAIVSEIVRYMYLFKVTISTENVEDLLKISDEYQVMGLFQKAQKYIVNHIESGNVIECLTLTEHITNATLLKSASIDYILDHYLELRPGEKLSSGLLKEILQHSKLNQRITDINAENADQLLYLAEKHHVKKLIGAVKQFKNQLCKLNLTQRARVII